MAKLPKRMSLVVVDWVDATVMHSSWGTEQDWANMLDAKPEGLLCTTVGYLLDSNEYRIVLVQSYNSHGHLADGISIPIGCLQTVRKLEPPPPDFS